MSDSQIAEAMPRGRRAVHQRLRVREGVRVAAFDCVRRQRERRAGKSDERDATAELALDLADRLEHVRQRLARFEAADARRGPRSDCAAGSRSPDLRRGRSRTGCPSARAAAADPRTESPRRPRFAHRLQRDLGGEVGRAAQIEERIALAQRAVLGHVAAGLPHEPDRRRVDRFAPAGFEESRFRRRSVGHLEEVARERHQIFEPQRLEPQLGTELAQLVGDIDRRGSSRR